jgi:FkbM family methyltransferase
MRLIEHLLKHEVTKHFRGTVERWTGLRVYRSLPRGVDVFADLKQAIPQFAATAVFDVGANVGQSVPRFRAAYPGAKVYCFEPVAESFDRLQHSVHSDPMVQCHRLALGSERKSVTMLLQGTPDRFRVSEASAGESTERARMDTLQHVCSDLGVAKISYLKIDTEGHDFEVLRGAESLLSEHCIDVVEAEVAMGPDNDCHVPFAQIVSYLESFKYRIFGIYEQVPEWPLNQPHLRRSNTVMISPRIVAAGSRPRE